MDETCGKVAVIAGATGGIGAAVAKALGGAGYRLVLNGRSREKLDALATEIAAPTAIIAGDLRDATVPSKLLAAALENFSRCDVCFNNGGILEVGPIQTIDIERVCEMARVNVEGAFRVAYTFMNIPEPLTPADIARVVLFILDQPAHVRIPQLMILPKGHEI
jgi:NADP-dependent 3-hydroxy acid dehydrogenase YdfG